jgi:hypothetical protein
MALSSIQECVRNDSGRILPLNVISLLMVVITNTKVKKNVRFPSLFVCILKDLGSNAGYIVSLKLSIFTQFREVNYKGLHISSTFSVPSFQLQ